MGAIESVSTSKKIRKTVPRFRNTVCVPRFPPVLAHTYSLDEFSDAMHYLETDRARDKVVMTVGDQAWCGKMAIFLKSVDGQTCPRSRSCGR